MCCPVCNEIKICISQPYCNHSLCVECFKECYGDNWEYDGEEPKFHYNEDIKDKWDDVNYSDEIEFFVNKYPLMKKYMEENDKWDDDKIEAWRKIKHFFCICPICKITKEIKYNQILENNEILRKFFNIFKKNWLMTKNNEVVDDTINKYEFYGIINQDVKCCILNCQKSMCNFNFGYIKHQLYFCEKPHVLCPKCFNKKEDNNSDFIPWQYEHLPKNTWNPSWIKVLIDKK